MDQVEARKSPPPVLHLSADQAIRLERLVLPCRQTQHAEEHVVVVLAETRRGAITLRAMVVTTIRPDTIFIPCHWPGEKSPNRLTVAAQDPISKIPQYKVCGCRVRKAEGPPEYASVLEAQQ